MAKKINIKGALMQVAGTGGGAIAASYLDKISFVNKLGTPVKGAIKVGLGVLVPAFLGKGKSKPMLDAVGNGMVAVGVLQLANATIFKTAPLSIAGLETVGDLPTVGSVYTEMFADSGATKGYASY